MHIRKQLYRISANPRKSFRKIRGKVLRNKSELPDNKISHLLILLPVDGAGGINQHSPRLQKSRGISHDFLLQGHQRPELFRCHMILDIPLPRNNSKARAGDVTDHQIRLFLKIRTRIGCIIFFHDDIMKLHPAKSGADLIRFLTRKIIGVNTALRKERSCQHGLSSRSSTKIIHLHSSEKIPLPSC